MSSLGTVHLTVRIRELLSVQLVRSTEGQSSEEAGNTESGPSGNPVGLGISKRGRQHMKSRSFIVSLVFILSGLIASGCRAVTVQPTEVPTIGPTEVATVAAREPNPETL